MPTPKKKDISSSFGQQVKDVVTGRAALEGAKVVGKAIFKNALKTDDRHNNIIRKKKMGTSDGYMYTK